MYSQFIMFNMYHQELPLPYIYIYVYIDNPPRSIIYGIINVLVPLKICLLLCPLLYIDHAGSDKLINN